MSDGIRVGDTVTIPARPSTNKGEGMVPAHTGTVTAVWPNGTVLVTRLPLAGVIHTSIQAILAGKENDE